MEKHRIGQGPQTEAYAERRRVFLLSAIANGENGRLSFATAADALGKETHFSMNPTAEARSDLSRAIADEDAEVLVASEDPAERILGLTDKGRAKLASAPTTS